MLERSSINQEVRQAFDRQTRRFRELFDNEMSLHGKPLGRTIAPPKAVLSFAEDLMLCPTEESAIIRMRRDLEAARGFRIISGDVASEVGKGHVVLAIPLGQNETPFCLVAAVVRLHALKTIERHGDSWLGPGFPNL